VDADLVHQHAWRCFGAQVVGNQERLAGLRVEEALNGAVGGTANVEVVGIELAVVAGGGLIILGFFIFVYEVLGTVGGGSGL
jgi:hypothetical protein